MCCGAMEIWFCVFFIIVSSAKRLEDSSNEIQSRNVTVFEDALTFNKEIENVRPTPNLDAYTTQEMERHRNSSVESILTDFLLELGIRPAYKNATTFYCSVVTDDCIALRFHDGKLASEENFTPTDTENNSKQTKLDKKQEWIQYQCKMLLPLFVDIKRCSRFSCFNQPLSKCKSKYGEAIYGFFVVLLALTIIFSNCLMPIVVWKRPEMRTQYDYIRVSLAFADMIPGIVLLVTVVPNMIWMNKLSAEEIIEYMNDDLDSPKAIVASSLLGISVQASLLHLAFLSVERFIAIKWPFWHMTRRTQTIVATLGTIWAVSVLTSIQAAYIFHFAYNAVILSPSVRWGILFADFGKAHAYATFIVVIPYIVMFIFCIMTSVVLRRKFAKRRERFGLGNRGNRPTEINVISQQDESRPKLVNNENAERIKPELTIFTNLIFMIATFTITFIPFAIVIFLHVGHVRTSRVKPWPSMITFFGAMANCFANAVIYSFRDQRFRDAVKSVFCSVFRR